MGPHREESSGSPEEEGRDALDYYRGIADDPGDIVVPTVPTMGAPEYAELGATWVLATDLGDGADETLETIRAGPPG